MRETSLFELARLRRRLLSARMVAVTGSAGKSTTSRLLRAALGPGAGGVDIYNTTTDIAGGLLRLPGDIETAVFEAGATGPGSIRRSAALLRPDVAVVTMVAREHHTAFRTLEAIAAEKGELVAALPENGLAVLNADDPLVAAMAQRTRARSVTFGVGENADYRISEVSFAFPAPLVVTIVCARGRYAIRSDLAGRHFAPDIAAAFAASVELGVPPQTAAARIGAAPPLHNRCQIVPVPAGPVFILDIKGAVHGIPIALDLLAEAKAPRKRAVIGHLADYRGTARKVYADAYGAAAAVADEVIFVGENAHRSRASAEDRAVGRFFEFRDAVAAREHIRATAVPGEVILVKGAAGFHLERIGMSFAEEVRCWEYRCGYSIGCHDCGMYGYPFAEHSRIRRARRRANGLFSRIRTMITGKPADRS